MKKIGFIFRSKFKIAPKALTLSTMNYTTYRKQLMLKTLSEINAMGEFLNYPLRGNKAERVNSLYQYMRFESNWNAISNN